jgi:hypothetical protein
MKSKTLAITIILMLTGINLYPQQLDFKAESIRLIPDETFMKDADWDKIFHSDQAFEPAGLAGLNKQIKIGPNGRVYVSDRYTYSISIYDQSGKFLKSFGRQGYGDGEFANNQDLDGFLNDKLIITSDNQGRINLFDLDGNFVKLITIDFMPLRIFPLKSGNMMVYGHVPVKGRKFKHVLAELNADTEKYKVVFEKMIDWDKNKHITITSDSNIISVGAPYSRGKELVRIGGNDQIILAENKSGEITILDLAGGKAAQRSFTVQGDPIPISDKEKEEFYQNFKARLIKNKMDPAAAEKIKEAGFFPEHLPYFYNLAIDEMNNLLFFIYTNNEGEDFAFSAYDLKGNFLGHSKFEIEGYDLLANVSSLKFKDGYIYTLALKKDAEHPLRILKCRVGE